MIKLVSTVAGGEQIAEALGIDPATTTRIIIDVDVRKQFVRAYVQGLVCDEGMCSICDLIKQWRENGLPVEDD